MFGLITGSGFYDIPDLENRTELEIATPFGAATVTTGTWRGREIAFVPRHGAAHRVPPAAINYRANIWALREAGVDSILATAVSGGIDPALKLGSLVVISDVLNFTTGRPDTFFDGSGLADTQGFDPSKHHVDMSYVYAPTLRSALLQAAADESIDVVGGGIYCCTNGPRFETPAEIAMMRSVGGDLVGMTGYPEAVLAVEAGLRYASIGIIANPAAGLGDEPLRADDVFAMIGNVTEPLHRLIDRAITLGIANQR